MNSRDVLLRLIFFSCFCPKSLEAQSMSRLCHFGAEIRRLQRSWIAQRADPPKRNGHLEQAESSEQEVGTMNVNE